MIRFCMGTVGPLKAIQEKTGRWTIEGLGGGLQLKMLLFVEQSLKPYNSTFYLTTSTKECLHRLSQNQSDISSVLVPIETESAEYFVPEAYTAGAVQFISGYGVKEGQTLERETATVFSNVDLLQPEVYIGAFSLLLLFISFIITRIILLCRRGGKSTLIRKELSRMFYYSSNRFKLITLLYSILMFYLVTSFLCLYKTSHVVIEKPFFARTYKESLEHETSVAYLNDQFIEISDGFKCAPPTSIKRKLWDKLVASGEKDVFDPSKYSADSIGQVLAHARVTVLDRSISVTSSLYARLMLSFGCSISPEDELIILKPYTDPSEKEIIYGPPMSKASPFTVFYALKFKRIFETHSMSRLYEQLMDVSQIIGQMIGTSSHHLWKQKVVCADENAFAPDTQVSAIPLSYFTTFLRACATVWLFAFVLNFLQVIYVRAHRGGRSKRKRL